jgi:hypothetical protein
MREHRQELGLASLDVIGLVGLEARRDDADGGRCLLLAPNMGVRVARGDARAITRHPDHGDIPGVADFLHVRTRGTASARSAGVKLDSRLAALCLSTNLFVSACAPPPECNSVSIPPTVISVNDGSSPVCGATVQAWRIFDDAMVNQVTFVEEVADGGACTGIYENFLANTGTWTIQVTKAGFKTSTVSVTGPEPVDCASGTGGQPQQVTVNLSP